jgi:hypothetical protein
MKDFFYSVWISLIFLIVMTYITLSYFSLPVMILYALFYVFYFERSIEWREFRKKQKIKK